MTETATRDTRPVILLAWPHIEIGKGGRFFYMGPYTRYPGEVKGFSFGWGGKARFNVEFQHRP